MGIRTRLTLISVVVMAFVFGATGILLHVRMGAELRNAVDDGLRSRADIILARIGSEGTGIAERGRLLESEEAFAQILSEHGGVVESSSGLRRAALLDPSAVHAVDTQARHFDAEVRTLDDRVPARLLAVRSGSGLVVVVGSSLEDQHDAVAALDRLLGFGGPAVLVVMTLVIWLLTRAALRPVDRMRVEAEAVSISEPGRRLPVPPTRDEIAQLGETLNRMLDRLEEALERERRFVDDASHELRTPVALLKGELELALSRPRTHDELDSVLRRAADETDALSRLAEDLLVLARSEHGVPSVRKEPTDLAELARQVASSFAQRASRQVVQIDTPASEATAEADPLRMRQAISNLIDNALRHTPAGGRISVEFEQEPDAIRMDVLDTGAGFDPEVLPRAFEPFARGREERAGTDRGTGLGLAIVRAVADAHGGSVRVWNRDEGGAAVSIRLPA